MPIHSTDIDRENGVDPYGANDITAHVFRIPADPWVTDHVAAPKDPNPKAAYGDKKPPLHLLPLAGMVHQSLAHMDGNLKYGFENWNETRVEKLTYIGAILRHLELYKYGESHARDTGVHNLGAVMGCCAILLDAELNGNLIDNTKHSKATCDLLHNAEVIVARLKEGKTEL